MTVAAVLAEKLLVIYCVLRGEQKQIAFRSFGHGCGWFPSSKETHITEVCVFFPLVRVPVFRPGALSCLRVRTGFAAGVVDWIWTFKVYDKLGGSPCDNMCQT